MKFIFFFIFCCASYALYGQSPEVYTAKPGAGECPATIILYPDATYFFKTGCEAAPQLSFGKWMMKRDTLKLEPVNQKTYEVIKVVSAAIIPGDSVWVSILDRDGVNMTAKISVGLEVSGRGSYMFGGDSTGAKKFVYKRSGGRIVLRTLNKLFARKFEWATDSANHFIITLNLSAGWVTSTHADWGGTATATFLRKGNAIISIAPKAAERLVWDRVKK